jgi:non-ribosomal peptide synthetase component F
MYCFFSWVVLEEKAKNTPNAIAVVYKDKEVTYKELNEEANKLANYLIQQGVKVEDLIGICVDRSNVNIFKFFGIII